jgi:N-acetyl sugar amidotransferase
MDTTTTAITFDENGICNLCTAALERLKQIKPADKAQKLEQILEWIRQKGRRRKYDCVIGISGGVDSSYVAWLVKAQFGLRPLAVHLDNGWNSELSVRNIEELVRRLDIELHTEVLDWPEFRSLQKAFLRSNTPDLEIPSDHAIFATIYKMCRREGIGFLISGQNAETESIMPPDWSWGHLDSKYIESVNKQFGERPLKTFPRLSLRDRILRSMNWPVGVVDILNYVDFNKKEAERLLIDQLGWRPYEQKHYESSYTKFYQGILLPKKFGIDKRKAHQSSLIVSGQTTRDAALAALQNPPVDEDQVDELVDYVAKKLGFASEEMRTVMTSPNRRFDEFPSQENSFYWKALKGLQAALRDGGA